VILQTKWLGVLPFYFEVESLSKHFPLSAAAIFLLAAGLAAPPAQAQAQAQTTLAAQRAVLDRYCVSCHNQKLKTAGLELDKLDLAHVPEQAEAWEKVVRKLRAGMMPPPGARRPDAAALSGLVVAWMRAGSSLDFELFSRGSIKPRRFDREQLQIWIDIAGNRSARLLNREVPPEWPVNNFCVQMWVANFGCLTRTNYPWQKRELRPSPKGQRLSKFARRQLVLVRHFEKLIWIDGLLRSALAERTDRCR